MLNIADNNSNIVYDIVRDIKINNVATTEYEADRSIFIEYVKKNNLDESIGLTGALMVDKSNLKFNDLQKNNSNQVSKVTNFFKTMFTASAVGTIAILAGATYGLYCLSTKLFKSKGGKKY